MTALLYYSYSRGLSENELFEIDKEVSKHRKLVYVFISKLPLNGKRKVKRICFYMIFVFTISQPLAPCAAVMTPLPQTAIYRLYSIEESRISTNTRCPQIAPIPPSKIDKIRLTNEQIKQFDSLAQQLSSGTITMEEAILQLRGGDGLTDIVAVIAFVIFANWYGSLFGGEAFQANPLPHMDPFGWSSGKYDSRNAGHSRHSTDLLMEKPASMPQQQYSGLTKSERRKLPDPKGRDGSIEVDGYPRLDLRFNQVEFKTPKHGRDHGLSTDDNGKTPKTEANATALRDSLINMPNRENVIWYKEGMYQGGTPRGCDCVNIFDPDKNLIAVYEKQPDGSNLFLTTTRVTQSERDHLIATDGNFVTERVLREQQALSTQIQDTIITNNNEIQ